MTSGASPTGIDRDALTDHEFAVAVAVAHGEIERLHLGRLVTSATATRGEGTVTDSNTGHACASGTLLQIKLIGDFRKIPHGGGMPGQPDESTSAVLLTADPETGQSCLIGVATGEQNPEANSVVLFTPALPGRHERRLFVAERRRRTHLVEVRGEIPSASQLRAHASP